MKPLWICGLLAACGGTNVGNGFRSDLVISGDNGSVPPEVTILEAIQPILDQTGWLRSFSAASLQEAQANIKTVVLLPQSQCEIRPPVDQWKVFTQKDSTIDFVSLFDSNDQSLDRRFSVDLAQGFSTCTLRFVLAPPDLSASSPYSLLFQWTTPGGRIVTVRSTQRHILGLRSSSPLKPETLQSGFESVLYRQSFLGSLSVPEGDGSPITIEPDTSPLLFRAFLRSFRQSFAGHALQEGGARQRSERLAQGSDDEDQVLETLNP